MTNKRIRLFLMSLVTGTPIQHVLIERADDRLTSSEHIIDSLPLSYLHIAKKTSGNGYLINSGRQTLGRSNAVI